MWEAVDALLDRAPTLADLRSHKLDLFAARRWRALGREVSPELAHEERVAAAAALAAPHVIERVRSACEGPILLLKGPEVAACYADPTLRSYGDIDLLVPNAVATQSALVAAGFEEVGDPDRYRNIHHLRPLRDPRLPLAIEIHSSPKWPDGLAAPKNSELFAVAVPAPSLPGLPDVLALPRAHHALVLAAHHWAHEPLRRLRDLIDVAATARLADRIEISALARRWKVRRLWETTIGSADALFEAQPPTLAMRIWAQNLAKVRERTVLETHLERLLSDFWGLPPRLSIQRLPDTLAAEVKPSPGETWKAKSSRSTRAARNALLRRSVHDQELERERLAHKVRPGSPRPGD